VCVVEGNGEVIGSLVMEGCVPVVVRECCLTLGSAFGRMHIIGG